jgi:curved DNA-binding protein CbpA
MKNPYETPGVSENAAADEIKSAYLPINCQVYGFFGGAL